MEFFVAKNSIVRQIWARADTILFIFAGSSAEFALNKSVDWLYFTGKLPADPLGRLFSTVAYARAIVFAGKDEANRAIDNMSHIHSAVENKRGTVIPEGAYRDVLFMLIHYSITAFELLERTLTEEEKQEVFLVFLRVGLGMGLAGLPQTYQEYLVMRKGHLHDHLENSKYTRDLFRQYKKRLGPVRFAVLKQTQLLLVPKSVKQLLPLGKIAWLKPMVPLYKWFRKRGWDGPLKHILVPSAYRTEVKNLDVVY